MLHVNTRLIKFSENWPSSSWEEDVNWRHTTDDWLTKDDDGRRLITIGHLSD